MLSNICSLILLILLVLFHKDCSGKGHEGCKSSSCGNLRNISYPFRLIGDPSGCGNSEYELSCENNQTVLHWKSGKYFVHSISYPKRTIKVLDSGLDNKDCSSLPRYSLTPYSFILGDPYEFALYAFRQYGTANGVVFVYCSLPITSPNYVDAAPCINGTTSSNLYTYVVPGDMTGIDLNEYCRIGMSVYTTLGLPNSTVSQIFHNLSYYDIHQNFLIGFELSWALINCNVCWHNKSSCELDYQNNIRCFGRVPLYWYILPRLFVIAMALLARAFCACPCVSIFLVYKFRRRHMAVEDGIEEFLQSYNSLVPIRYSYADVKKMTKGFTEKLGQGGFGSVFKGKLRSGRFVAVKMLGKSKSKGQDFMSEVATIGRIHHFNVVQLTGFCAEGSKRALIYDFMPNGSLEKYIFCQHERNMHLISWETMYEIALVVARGIEYLHCGCEMQILHFDIKPHNILLDDKFRPKISDFGLAKLYSTDDSIVTLTAARGTIGYIAPELFYKNIGRVSYKADVYSFGMLLMEMAGRRKNLNAQAENSSQIYYPMCVYELLNRGEQMEIGDATEDEKRIAKKLAMVALWCIQLKPTDRPSMGKVVEMLESALESLEMPPRLCLVPEDRIVVNSRLTFD